MGVACRTSWRIRQALIVAFSLVSCVSVRMPWWYSWRLRYLEGPGVIYLNVWPLESWIGWCVILSGPSITFLAAWTGMRGHHEEKLVKLQMWIAVATILAVLIASAIHEFEERPGNIALGADAVTWWWVRWEIGIPLLANLGIGVLCMWTLGRRPPSQRHGSLGNSS